jgi:hypothetical protein
VSRDHRLTEVVAAIDVGNATTEVLLGRVAGGVVEVLAAGRRPTRRTKGSAESLAGAVALVRRLERTHGLRVTEALAVPLRPVLSSRAAVPLPGPDTGRLRVVGHRARTAGAPGFGAGSPVLLDDLRSSTGPHVVVVPSRIGYIEAVALLGERVARGDVAAVLLEADEGVLVANRLPDGPDGAVPVLDEVPVDEVLAVGRVAVEVAPRGRPLRRLTDPLRLAEALDLDHAQTEAAALVAAELYDASHGVVLLGEHGRTGGEPAGWASFAGDGKVALADAHATVRQRGLGVVDGYALPPEEVAVDVDDLWTVDLSEIGGRVRVRAGSAGTKALGIAGLTSAGALVDPAGTLAAGLQVPVRVVGTEAEAARRGALTTPRVPDDAVVVDLGGGTIDVVTATHAVVAAGAGDLLTLCVAELTGTTGAAAEWVKRGPSRRAEAPQVVLSEDGRRTFLDAPLPSDALGSLVVEGPAGWLAFGDDLAPSEWRALRLDLKVDLIGGNITRALRSLDQDLAGTILLVGGPAADEEILAAVAGALPQGAVVSRGNVGGSFAHRYGVAHGLLAAGAE